MLTKSQLLKQNDDHVHEDGEVGTAITNGRGVTNINHVVEDVETLCDNVISKDESLLLGCANKMYEVFIEGT